MRTIMHKDSGFTLMELMVTIAIILILASIAVPSYLSWLPKYRLRSAVTDLVADIQFAKLQAVRENRDWAIVFNTATERYFVCSDNGANDGWDGPVSNAGDDICVKTIRLSRLGSGVELDQVTPGPPAGNKDHMDFNSRGLCSRAVEVELTNMTGSPIYSVQTTMGGAVFSEKQ